mmetsp:Transcript_40298/g.106912  ORF Transcript_40298/g.106912 Transcript_40298/m.106912 type:complete len:218 (+) Transcript_40298:1267-1920(+)
MKILGVAQTGRILLEAHHQLRPRDVDDQDGDLKRRGLWSFPQVSSRAIADWASAQMHRMRELCALRVCPRTPVVGCGCRHAGEVELQPPPCGVSPLEARVSEHSREVVSRWDPQQTNRRVAANAATVRMSVSLVELPPHSHHAPQTRSNATLRLGMPPRHDVPRCPLRRRRCTERRGSQWLAPQVDRHPHLELNFGTLLAQVLGHLTTPHCVAEHAD